MTFRILSLFILFFVLKNRALASESPPDPAPPALVGDNLTRSPANGIVDEDQIIQCFLNEEIPDKVQWFTINQDGNEEELQTNDGLTSIKAENAALKYRCKIDENTYADFVVRKGDLFFVKAYLHIRFQYFFKSIVCSVNATKFLFYRHQ